jgi:rhomboid protease GluP
MFGRARSGSVLCPSCGSLVGVRDAACLRCGRRNPGLFGFAQVLRGFGEVGDLIAITCVVLYVATLAVDPSRIFSGGLLAVLGPSFPALFAFGASGAIPVLEAGRWWTVLTAGWLHGGLLHIALNIYYLRPLAHQISEIYGAGRTLIVFVVGSAIGFVFSTFGVLAPAPVVMIMGGGGYTVGASAGILALVGALYAWAERTGNRYATSRIWSMLGFMALFGILGRGLGIDNWAHLGGFVGGWAIGRLLDPLTPERGDHLLVALALLVATAGAFTANLLLAFGVI